MRKARRDEESKRWRVCYEVVGAEDQASGDTISNPFGEGQDRVRGNLDPLIEFDTNALAFEFPGARLIRLAVEDEHGNRRVLGHYEFDGGPGALPILRVTREGSSRAADWSVPTCTEGWTRRVE
jgi:hypothetical protein